MRQERLITLVLTVVAVTSAAAARSVEKIEEDIQKKDAAIKTLETNLEKYKDWCSRWRLLQKGIERLNALCDTYERALKPFEKKRQDALKEFKTQYRLSVWSGVDDIDGPARDAMALLHAKQLMGEESRGIWESIQRRRAAGMIEHGPRLKTDKYDTAAKALKSQHAAYRGKKDEFDREIADNEDIAIWGDGNRRHSLEGFLELRRQMNARLRGKTKKIKDCPETIKAMTAKLDVLHAKRRQLDVEKHAAQFPITFKVITPSAEELAKPYELTPPGEGVVYLMHLQVDVTNLPPGLHRLRADMAEAGDRYLWARVNADDETARFAGFVPVPYGKFRITLRLADIPVGNEVVLEGTMKRSSLSPGQKTLDRIVKKLERLKAEANAELRKPASEREGTALYQLPRAIYFTAREFYWLGRYETAQKLCDQQITWYKRIGQQNAYAMGAECYALQAQMVFLAGDYEAYAGLTKKQVLDHLQELRGADEDDREAPREALAITRLKWALAAAMLVPDKAEALREARLRLQSAIRTDPEFFKEEGWREAAKPVWAP